MRKINCSLTVVIIILLVVVLSLGGYIVYDKVLNNSQYNLTKRTTVQAIR